MNAAQPGERTGQLSRLARACRRHPWVAGGTIAASVVGVASQAVYPLAARVAVDGAVHGSVGELPVLIAVLAANAVLGFATSAVRRYLSGRLSLDVQYDLRRAVFASAVRFDGRQQDAMRTGQVVARALTDLQQVQSLLSTVPIALGYLVLILVSFGAMLWLSPLLSLVALVVLPLSALLTVRSRRRLFPVTWSAQQRVADIAQHVEETVTGVRVVKGFGQEEREVAAFERRALRLFRERMEAARTASRLSPPLTVMPVLGLIGVFALGGVLALHGGISLGTFLAFSTFVSNLVVPVRVVGGLVVTAQLAMAGIGRVYDIIDARPAIADPERPASLPGGPLALEFEDVVFRYTDDADAEPVLRNVSFALAPGETVAVVGTAGSGKSTVGRLVPRFYDPQAGEVRLGGVALGALALAELRGELGIVSEDPFLFNDTIRANIAYARPDATLDEVRAAARTAQADEFVLGLPDGYDTVVGDRGLMLSGGQRQRIALARALLSDPRVILLDDATSAVDTATEQAIHTGLAEAIAGRTALLIARRRSTLALADRIVVLDHGCVVDVGTAEELDARGALDAVLVDEDHGAHEHQIPDAARMWPDSDVTERVDTEAPATVAAEETTADGVPSRRADLPRTGDLDPRSPGVRFGLWRLLRPVRLLVLLAAVLVAADTASTLIYPELARLAVDDGIDAHASGILATASVLGVLVVAADWLVCAAQIRVTARASESVLYTLRLGSFAHLQRLGLDFYEREQAGRIMTRMTTDVNALSSFLQTGLAQSATGLLTVCGVVVALVVTDPALAWVALAPVPVLLVVNWLLRPRVFRIYAESRELVSAVNTDLQENIAGLPVVQSSVREDANLAAFDRLAAAYQASRFRAQRYIAVFFPLIELICQASLVAVLAAGADLVATGRMTPGVLTAFLLYLQLFFGPLQTVSALFDGYQQAKVGLTRIDDLMRTPSSVSDAADGGVAMPERLRGEIELRDVSFRYADDAGDVLHKVSLHIRPGETVALVGTTGAGKSTLVKLLARFHDVDEGRILVDGVDVRRYPLGGYRRRLGVVPQEAHLFTGDVAANIAYGRPDATRAQIEQAAREVGALEMIARLPGGFRQPVGEGGRGLSAGQRQLLALARAEIVGPDLVLLDEATAALDPATEALVVRATSRLSRRATPDGAGGSPGRSEADGRSEPDGRDGRDGRTTVLVAHRLATAARADRIVVLEAGRIAEQGTHTELLARDGRYAALWRAGGGPTEPPPPPPSSSPATTPAAVPLETVGPR